MRKISTTVAAIFAVALLALPGTARGQDVQIGPQLSVADDFDLGLGGRAAFNVGDAGGWEGMGSFDLFFPDGDVDYWELNGNLVYNFPVEETRTFFPYLGGGLNIGRAEVSGVEDTKLGLNVVGGSKFDAEGVTPFVEARVEIEGYEQFVITGGLLFP